MRKSKQQSSTEIQFVGLKFLGLRGFSHSEKGEMSREMGAK